MNSDASADRYGNVIARAGFKQFNWKMSYRDLEGKVFILTGANSEIDWTTVILGQQGAKVEVCLALACNVQSAEEVSTATKMVVDH